jgi:hypothetical protein
LLYARVLPSQERRKNPLISIDLEIEAESEEVEDGE